MFYTSVSVFFFFFNFARGIFPQPGWVPIHNTVASKLFFSAIGSFLQSRGTPNKRQATAKLLSLRRKQPLKVPPTPPPGF